MTVERFADMTTQEFDELLEGYITRTEKGYGELPSEFFLELLFERMASKTEETLQILLNIQDGKLVITPDRESSDILVHGNEILVGKHRLSLQLVGVGD